MSIAAVGLLSPGDMGHAVGRALREHGLDVLTCLDGRSDRTRALSAAAGLRDVPSLDDLVAVQRPGAVDPGACRGDGRVPERCRSSEQDRQEHRLRRLQRRLAPDVGRDG